MTSAQVKAQLIANGAAKIRAALVQSINAKAIVAGYMEIHPVVTDSPARDRAQARAWAIMTVNTKNDPLRQALRGIYATLYAFGLNEGKELMARALRSNKGAISARLNHSHAQLLTATIPIDSKFVMDWSAWKPGNEAAALLLDPPGGLAKLLDGIDIKSLVNTTLDQLGTQLADGLRVGATPTQIARSIQDSVTSSSRSLTISLTEGSRAAIEANRQSFVEQGVEQWEWSVNDPEDEDCLENDGEVVDIGEDFPSGDAQPPVHPNCFPAGVLVQSPQVVGAIERWYEGEMVELTTSEGIVLPATPNHPILTPNGWVAAGLLEVGQEVIHYPNFKREALVYPNDDYIPTCIEKVVHAFARSSSVTTREVPVTAPDFHNDGIGSNVAVIHTNSLVRNRKDFFIFKPFKKYFLGTATKPTSFFNTQCAFSQIFNRTFTPANCIMRGFNSLCVLFRSSFAGVSPISITSSSQSDTVINQEGSNKRSANSNEFAQALNGLASEITLNDLLNVELVTIVNARKFNFSGHVYNLETLEGWYIANGIVTHNCQCSIKPSMPDMSEFADPNITDAESL